MSDALIGSSLGKYKIVGRVGKGGMATVYRAHQTDVDRFVALKVLPPQPGRDPQFAERFKNEARTVARLQHPYIVPLYDYGEQDGILYLVTPLLETGSLADRMKRGALKLADVERMLRQLADALDYAHRQGVIHRDIKPDNILLDAHGNALLVDFGIAKVTMDAPGLTATGSMVGTPAYMSPQQAQGVPVDQQTDQYSLAVVVFEMIAGELPYNAETSMQIVIKHITAPVPSLLQAGVDVPPALDGVMKQAMAKDPAARFSTVTAFAEAFSEAIRGADIQLPTATAMRRSEKATQNLSTPSDMSLTPSPAVTVTPPPVNATPTPTLPPTVIVQQQGVNPAALFGGFGIIATLLIVIVIVLLTGQERASAPTNTTPQAAAVTAESTEVAAVAAAPTPTAIPSLGRVSFATTDSLGDTAILSVNGLAQPPQGQRYYVWLAGEESTIAVGEIALDSLGSGALTYIDPDGRLLPLEFNQVSITAQEPPGDEPGGEVAYSGSIPAEVASALGAILIASDEGINGASLLDSALTEAGIARQHAGLSAGAGNVGGMHVHAEHTINILRGTQDDFDGNGRGENPGRGFGVPVFLERIDGYLNNIVAMPEVSRDVQQQAELIRVCTRNAAVWVDEMVALEQEIVAAESLEAVAEQRERSTVVAQQLIEGFDLNENGQVEPFEGECGLTQIGQYGILVGNITIQNAAEGETS